MKICSGCHKEKTLSDFSNHKRNKDGKRYRCKECEKIQSRIYRENNPEKVKETHKKYLEKIGVEELKRYKKEYYSEKGKYEEYPSRSPEYIKKNYGDKRSAYAKEYNKNNRDKINNREKQRYHSDNQFRMSCVLRSRIRGAIKNKSDSLVGLLGTSISNFLTYTEGLWLPGMSWDNYGVPDKETNSWQIDHIKPCSSFDLNDPKQQKECFHYTNLQPLWALDWTDENGYIQDGNYSKSDKIP